jgi:hypothetical protein
MGSGDDMHRNQLTDTLGGRSAGIRGSFHCTDIAAHKDGNQAAADKLSADKSYLCCLYHGISRLNSAYQTSGFNHSQRLFSHSFFLLILVLDFYFWLIKCFFCTLLVTGHWSLVTCYWVLVTGYWLLVTGFWSLVTGYLHLVDIINSVDFGLRQCGTDN